MPMFAFRQVVKLEGIRMRKFLALVALFILTIVAFPTANHIAAQFVDLAASLLGKLGMNLIYVPVIALGVLIAALFQSAFKRS